MFGGVFNPFSVGAEGGGSSVVSDDESIAGSDAETVIEKPKLDDTASRKFIVKKPEKPRHAFRGESKTGPVFRVPKPPTAPPRSFGAGPTSKPVRYPQYKLPQPAPSRADLPTTPPAATACNSSRRKDPIPHGMELVPTHKPAITGLNDLSAIRLVNFSPRRAFEKAKFKNASERKRAAEQGLFLSMTTRRTFAIHGAPGQAFKAESCTNDIIPISWDGALDLEAKTSDAQCFATLN